VQAAVRGTATHHGIPRTQAINHYKCPTPEGEFLCLWDLLGMAPARHTPTYRPDRAPPNQMCASRNRKREKGRAASGRADHPAGGTTCGAARPPEGAGAGGSNSIASGWRSRHALVRMRSILFLSVRGAAVTLPRVGPPSFGTLPPMPWCGARHAAPSHARVPSIAAPWTGRPSADGPWPPVRPGPAGRSPAGRPPQLPSPFMLGLSRCA